MHQHCIFRSTSTNPFLNLSLEHYLFKHIKNDRKLFLYINDPCVVIGRNQNPWRECNLPLLRQLNIPLVRRRSGGGTVVHDRGNVNFSVMTPREEFSRDKHAQMIVDKMNSLPSIVQTTVKREINEEHSNPNGFPDVEIDGDEIPIQVNGPQVKLKLNERYDIVTIGGKKVSGSAYKIERQRAYHHGTMLLDSRLDVLGSLLHRNVQMMGKVEGRGVESVKSPVANVGCDSEVFINSTCDAFRELYDINEEKTVVVGEDDMPQEVIDSAIEMQTWDWKFTHTPDFVHTFNHPEHDYKVEFRVSKGAVSDVCGLDAAAANKLVGKKYIPENIDIEWISQAL